MLCIITGYTGTRNSIKNLLVLQDKPWGRHIRMRKLKANVFIGLCKNERSKAVIQMPLNFYDFNSQTNALYHDWLKLL